MNACNKVSGGLFVSWRPTMDVFAEDTDDDDDNDDDVDDDNVDKLLNGRKESFRVLG